MFISLHELEKRPIDFGEHFAPGTVDLGADLRQSGTLNSSGRATLIEEHRGHKSVIQDIRLVGEMSTEIEIACARCLEPVRRDVARSFELLYRPRGSDAGREELSVTAVEADIGYYDGDGLLLEDVLREQILLAIPLKIVCREECKVLCPTCGKNLNEGGCQCSPETTDVRWSALEGLKDKLQK